MKNDKSLWTPAQLDAIKHAAEARDMERVGRLSLAPFSYDCSVMANHALQFKMTDNFVMTLSLPGDNQYDEHVARAAEPMFSWECRRSAGGGILCASPQAMLDEMEQNTPEVRALLDHPVFEHATPVVLFDGDQFTVMPFVFGADERAAMLNRCVEGWRDALRADLRRVHDRAAWPHHPDRSCTLRKGVRARDAVVLVLGGSAQPSVVEAVEKQLAGRLCGCGYELPDDLGVVYVAGLDDMPAFLERVAPTEAAALARMRAAKTLHTPVVMAMGDRITVAPFLWDRPVCLGLPTCDGPLS